MALQLGGCLFFDEPDLGDDPGGDDDSGERVDCFAGLPEQAAAELLPGPCKEIIDDYADGTADATWIYAYDEDGRRVSLQVDPSIVRYVYDERGNIERIETDREGDGRLDSIELHGYACFLDDEEPPGPLPGPCSIDRDTDADGSPDFEQTFDYEEGRLIAERHVSEGRVLSTIAHEYDDEGRLTKTSIDTLGDGRIDSATKLGYDREGHLIYRRFDSLDDGTIESSTEYTLDAAGRTRIAAQFSFGELTSTTRFDYDGEGRVVLETTSYPNQRNTIMTERRYDPAGNLLAEGDYHESLGAFEQCRRYEYACF